MPPYAFLPSLARSFSGQFQHSDLKRHREMPRHDGGIVKRGASWRGQKGRPSTRAHQSSSSGFLSRNCLRIKEVERSGFEPLKGNFQIVNQWIQMA